MRELGIRYFIQAWALGVAVLFSSFAEAEEKPVWELEVTESKLATFEAVQLHPKENGWLMTCRMRVKSLRLIAPISQLEFKGIDAAEEEVWEKSHTIRRKDFEAAYGGGRSLFVRVFLNDVPDEVSLVELTYGEEDESEAEE